MGSSVKEEASVELQQQERVQKAQAKLNEKNHQGTFLVKAQQVKGMMGSPEAVSPSEEGKLEGVSGPKQGHPRAEITLTWRQGCTQHQSYLMTMSV